MILYSLVIILFFSCMNVSDDSLLHFASVEEAKALLATEDSFTEAWSQFDIDSRMGESGSTKDALMQHIREQVVPWSDEDRTKLSSSLERVRKKISDNDLIIPLPDKITVVKTTGKEEGGAGGYTRGEYIVFCGGFSDMKEDDVDRFFVHELFHVVSRNNPELRERLYKIIGFGIMPSIEYPDVLKPYRITNPDATQTDSYIVLKVGKRESVPCMMILYSTKPYDGGSFFNYLNIGFLELEGEEEMSPVINDEGPVIHNMNEVSGFYEQVGKNTQYIIHPEEIMADNFSYAMLGKEGLKSPIIVNRVRKVLRY